MMLPELKKYILPSCGHFELIFFFSVNCYIQYPYLFYVRNVVLPFFQGKDAKQYAFQDSENPRHIQQCCMERSFEYLDSKPICYFMTFLKYVSKKYNCYLITLRNWIVHNVYKKNMNSQHLL